MRRKSSYGKGGRVPLFPRKKRKRRKRRRNLLHLLCIMIFVGSAVVLGRYGVCAILQSAYTKNTQEKLQMIKEEEPVSVQVEMQFNGSGLPVVGINAFIDSIWKKRTIIGPCHKAEIMPEYQSLYDMNHDMAGWLSIDGTIVDYPVMQTPEDEGYYLDIDFYGKPDKNGCLILDTDSKVGTGTKDCGYTDGDEPSTNLIIHGHTMKSGDMFGSLKLYAEEGYGKEHNRICFDSLYEERVYELIAVFYSQVYYEKDEVFKYYKFFQANTKEEFNDWYKNIKKMSLYDTGVCAEFGDEFITLSCCSYHAEDGRFVVVGKRVE